MQNSNPRRTAKKLFALALVLAATALWPRVSTLG